jgi:hypothetical protein
MAAQGKGSHQCMKLFKISLAVGARMDFGLFGRFFHLTPNARRIPSTGQAKRPFTRMGVTGAAVRPIAQILRVF